MKKAKLHEIFLASIQIGFTAFGGGAAMISYVRKIVVDDKEWIDVESFDQMAIIANILPGPVIVQLLALIHYKTRGIGGVIASLVPIIFILPLIFIGSVSIFETAIPQSTVHKITLALIPFILILTAEYIFTLFRVQIKKNETKNDWIFTILLSIVTSLCLYLGVTTTLAIFLYLGIVICYSTFKFKQGGEISE